LAYLFKRKSAWRRFSGGQAASLAKAKWRFRQPQLVALRPKTRILAYLVKQISSQNIFPSQSKGT